MDNEATVTQLKEKVKLFCEARDWDQFHNAKELAIALIIESAELLEPFRWKTPSEVDALFNNTEKRTHIGEEMADVLFFLLRLAQKYNIDLSDAIDNKINKNNMRYPVEKSKGSSKKYTEL